MSQFNLFEGMSSSLLDYVHGWADVSSAIITAVLPLITIGLTITIMWQGYGIVRGAGGRDHLLDVVFSSLRAFFVVALALSAGAYASNIITLFTELREWLTGLFTGKDNSYAALDATISATLDSYKKIQDYSLQNISVSVMGPSDFSGLLILFEGLVILAVVLIYCVVAAINLVVIDVALALTLAVGPLFVACLAFNATSSFFNNWLSTALKYVMTAVFIAAVIGFANAIVARFSQALDGDPATMDLIAAAASALGGGVMLIILAGKAAALGSEMVGSVAMQITSLAKGMHQAASGAKTVGTAGLNATQGAGKVIGYGAGQLAGRAGAHIGQSGFAQSSKAMKYSMAGIDMASRVTSSTGRAMSQRSVASALHMGAQRGGASVRNAGIGEVSRG